MEDKKRVQRREPPEGGSRRSTRIRYSPEEKVKAVRLVLEDGFSRGLVAEEVGAVSEAAFESRSNPHFSGAVQRAHGGRMWRWRRALEKKAGK